MKPVVVHHSINVSMAEDMRGRVHVPVYARLITRAYMSGLTKEDSYLVCCHSCVQLCCASASTAGSSYASAVLPDVICAPHAVRQTPSASTDREAGDVRQVAGS